MSVESAKKWILKAENDLKIAKDEITMENPATDAICFHAQQCAEKYLKAYLIFNNKEVRKTHDIAELISLCSEVDPEFSKINQIDIVSLTDYAVEILGKKGVQAMKILIPQSTQIPPVRMEGEE